MTTVISVPFGGKSIIFETGKMAKLASGSVLVRCGGTAVLATAVAAKQPSELDFVPLACHYTEQSYANGRIPGGFFKREGRPNEREVLTSRLMDRPLRPLFPTNWRSETQVVALVVSADQENDPAILAMLGASAALMVSDIPFDGPVAATRLGRVDGDWVLNPSPDQMALSDVDLLVAGTEESMVMVEGGANFVPDAEIAEALAYAGEALKPLAQIQKDLRAAAGKTKRPHVDLPADDLEAVTEVRHASDGALRLAFNIESKVERNAKYRAIKQDIVERLGDEAGKLFKAVKRDIARELAFENRRIGGRTPTQVREIVCETAVLPRTHGSALFTRGETQALVTCTLGSSSGEQTIRSVHGDVTKRFMLHYNFPAFSVGEARRAPGPGRREIGHGVLAERAVRGSLPETPYMIRVVSDILESDGSSSMASVCGATLCLMDAGIQIEEPVAGIAMGLIVEPGRHVVLSDICEDEDHLGDMDFKVCGSANGVTAVQMDIKVKGVTVEILRHALEQARDGRRHILSIMDTALPKARATVAEHAPRFATVKIDPDKIGALIGPGGKNIRDICEKTGAQVGVEQDGTVTIFAVGESGLEAARSRVEDVTREAKEGDVYTGMVTNVRDFGAFVEIFPGTEGLLHISQISAERVENVSDVLAVGDTVEVKVLEVGDGGRIRLSRRALLV